MEDATRNDGILFEHHVVKYHRETYGHTVWHSSCIPEEELINAGIIHDMNKLRMKRLAAKRECRPYVDYGIDFLSKETKPDNTVIYHAGQAKNYTTKSVTAADIGTFLAVTIGQVKETAYLYTTSKLQIDLAECISNSGGKILHSQLDFDTCKPVSVVVKTRDDETTKPLRDYQTLAIQRILGPGKKAVSIGCGLGKTLIAGHVLKAAQYHRVVCAAPLLISVDQLRERILPFLPAYKEILVDSAYYGTRDTNTIQSALASPEPLIIFTTFQSAHEILAPFLTGEEYLVVDEVHNAVNYINIHNLCNRAKNSLYMSATIPVELLNVMEYELVFSYNMRQGIDAGYICDYSVHIPSNMKDNTYETKALFLAKGLLRTGSKRCIVYLPRCEDCEVFNEVFSKVMEEYHGISNSWCGTIHASISNKDRLLVMDRFTNSPLYNICIISSVRILDEAVDIPCCDSEFIANVGENTSDIRTIQRLQRGGRLDPNNPNKRNNLFMWVDEPSTAERALNLLTSVDPVFHKKLRTFSPDYLETSECTSLPELSAYTTTSKSISEVVCNNPVIKACAPEQQQIIAELPKRKERCKQINYECPRCLYSTPRKVFMRNHMYDLKNICPVNPHLGGRNIDLSDEVRLYVLANHVYVPKVVVQPERDQPAKLIKKVITQNNTINSYVSKLDTFFKIDNLMEFRNVSLDDFGDHVKEKYEQLRDTFLHNRFRGRKPIMYDNASILEIFHQVTLANKEHLTDITVYINKTNGRIYISNGGGEWEDFSKENGVCYIVDMIVQYLLEAYEVYMIRKMEGGDTPLIEKAELRTCLDEYYRFISSFKVKPFVHGKSDAAVMYNNDEPTEADAETHVVVDKYNTIFMKASEEMTPAKRRAMQKSVLNVITSTSNTNILELNNRIKAIIKMDAHFKAKIFGITAPRILATSEQAP